MKIISPFDLSDNFFKALCDEWMLVTAVNKDGKVLATYKSIADAASRNGCCYETIKAYCNSKKPRYTNGGLTFRYKKSK